MKDEKKELKKIKSGLFSRSLALAKLSVNTSSGLAGHGLSTLFSNEQEKATKWKAFLEAQAGGLQQELGQLKGSLMKAGQMLSMYGEHFLPPEANQLLKTLQSQSPPLSWDSIYPIIQERLSPSQLAALEIETKPIGSASLGQVHRARIKATGEWIALKIQYPGVDKAIDSDLKAIRSFLSLLKLLPKNLQMDSVFQEIRQMLQQEMDYEQEATQTEKYHALLKDDARYIVPKVFREFSGPKILATSFERGLSPDDPMVIGLSPERRNQLSLNFIDLYFRELFEWGIVQTDPHLGNYRIRLNPDGKDQLILLDFGAVRNYPEEFLKPYHQMIYASLKNDDELLRVSAKQLKFLHEDDDPALIRHFEEFCLSTVEPFLAKDDPRVPNGLMDSEGRYNWKASDLPTRLTKKAFQMIQKFQVRTPPKEVLFLDRKTGGVFVFLCVLRANVKARDIILKYLEKN